MKGPQQQISKSLKIWKTKNVLTEHAYNMFTGQHLEHACFTALPGLVNNPGTVSLSSTEAFLWDSFVLHVIKRKKKKKYQACAVLYWCYKAQKVTFMHEKWALLVALKIHSIHKELENVPDKQTATYLEQSWPDRIFFPDTLIPFQLEIA